MRMKFVFYLIATLFISCEEQITDNVEYKEIYSLNFIVRADTSIQYATITKSFERSEKETQGKAMFVSGAKIKLMYKNKVYFLKDTLITSKDNLNNRIEIPCYYLINFKPESNNKISVEAYLPNGKILKSSSTTYVIYPNFVKFSSLLIPDYYSSKKMKTFDWSNIDMMNKIEDIYFGPELKILYYKNVNGIKEYNEKNVPLFYIGGTTINYPNYPIFYKNMTKCDIDTSAIRQSLVDISIGYPDKNSIVIQKIFFRLTIIDNFINTYYSAEKTFINEFSVRTTMPNYTNIIGGSGIFGTYNRVEFELEVRKGYLDSYGYKLDTKGY